jgi:hypothetical protein
MTVATLVARNANEALLASVVGSARNLLLAGVWSQAVVLCWCVWQESGFSRGEYVFTFNIHLI